MPAASREEILEDLNNKTKELKRLNEAAKPYATVAYVDKKLNKAICRTCNGSLLENNWALNVEPGETVILHPETGQIYARGIMSPTGSVVTVAKMLEGGLMEVEGHGGVTVVMTGKDDMKIEEGCRVALDPTGCVAVLNLGKPAGEYERGETGVSWDDIGGLEFAKQQMIQAVELPHKFPDLFKHYNQSAPKGIALIGPPGCGKTMLGKAAATCIARLHEVDVEKGLGSGFMYVKGPEVLSKWVGEAESEIRSLYARARSHKKERGYPAVLFIDEAESLLSKRGSGVSSDMEKTIVPTFLAEMDGIDAASAITILATNRADRLDSAIVRDGRVDWKVKVSRPSRENFEEIVRLNLRTKPIMKNGKDASHMAHAATAALFDPELVISTHEKGRDRVDITLADLRTGAMAANLVATATWNALRRDLAKGGKPTYLETRDFEAAVQELTEANRHIDHDDALREVLEMPERRKPKVAKREPQTAVSAAVA